MILYKDLMTGDEMFTDAFPMHYEGEDDFLVCVEGKLVSRKKGESISADLIGGNPSQEEQEEECCDDTETVSGIDVVLDNQLEDVQASLFPSKGSLVSYLKKFVKKVVDGLTEEGDAEKCDCFKKAMSAHIKQFVGKYSDDVSVYVREGFDVGAYKQAPMIGVWSEDGRTIKLYAMKHCLIEEKC